MKKLAVWLVKAGVSGIIAFCVLTGFCMLYYNMPVHSSIDDGATDYTWQTDKFYSRGTEGFAWGKTNNEGYLNPFDYTYGEAVDILVMGSSYMEAYQVAMDESTAAVLGKLLPDYTVYNIGASSHDFLVCADNFTAAIDKYSPSEYVILEAANLLYTEGQLTAAIQEEVSELPSQDSGIIGMLQKNQFLRLLYKQLTDTNNNSEAPQNPDGTATTRGSEKTYDALLAKLSGTASQNGAKLIIVYHPHLRIHEDGSVTALCDEELSAFFADICKRNEVEFLDMSDLFVKEYQEKHVLPYGFSNTSVGSGHLNKYGHEMVANAIYTLIGENG